MIAVRSCSSRRKSCGKVQQTSKGMGSNQRTNAPEECFRLSISENQVELNAAKKVNLTEDSSVAFSPV